MRCRTRCLTCARRRLSRWLLRRILIGFFQIATQIGRVFEVDFPEDVKRVLKSMEVVVTLGFDVLGTWTPLACAGMGGYAAQLRFWAITPFVLVLMILIGTALLLMMQKVKVTLAAVLLTAAPIVLQLFFLVFPVVTREAFEAFPCHEFNDGRSYLRADVAIECDTDDHGAGAALQPRRRLQPRDGDTEARARVHVTTDSLTLPAAGLTYENSHYGGQRNLWRQSSMPHRRAAGLATSHTYDA